MRKSWQLLLHFLFVGGVGGRNENYDDVLIGSRAQVIDSLGASVEFGIFWSTYDGVQSVRRSVAELCHAHAFDFRVLVIH